MLSRVLPLDNQRLSISILARPVTSAPLGEGGALQRGEGEEVGERSASAVASQSRTRPARAAMEAL